MIRAFFVVLLALAFSAAKAESCDDKGVWLQVLGSGGPQVRDRRAGSSYVVWIDGKARALIDAGGGSALRFGESGAQFADLDVILLSHLHADHTADLPALIQSSLFEPRTRPLPLFGPEGNRATPSTVTFVRTLFDPTRGAYRYLSEVLSPQDSDGYKLRPRDISTKAREIGVIFTNERLQVAAVPVVHGSAPTLAWRISAGGRNIVFLADASANNRLLTKLASGADIIVAHVSVPEGESRAEVAPYMSPASIAQLAASSGAHRLVLAHRAQGTIAREAETVSTIRRSYPGQLDFAEDLSCFRP